MGDQRMSHPTFKADQLARLKERHIAPFNNLVEELGSRDDGGRLPWIAPMYFGRESRVLCVLRDPGKRADAAAGSGFLCIENTDETSRRQKRMMQEAGIDPPDMLPWNAYPWFVDRAPSTNELELGVDPLVRVMREMPRLRAVMLMGSQAQKSWQLVLRHHADMILARGIRWVPTYHPSPSALQTAVPGERAARNASLNNAYAIVADVLEKDA